MPEENWVLKKVRTFGTAFTSAGFKGAVTRRIPIVKWLPKYQKSNILSDIIAGITVGVYNVPQAMSYSTLAGLPPVYGLYASFFPPLLYAFFGTSNHTSIGVFSITCMMVNKCIQKVMHLDDVFDEDALSHIKNITAVEIVTSLCLLTGIVQSVMAIIRCDKMMKFLSNPAISAITFSSCFFGLFSQIPKMLGISIPSRDSRFFNLYYNIYEIIMNLHETNMATLTLSLSCLFFLLAMKLWVEPKLRKSSCGNIPFPTELITIVTTTFLSYYFDFEKRFGIKTIHTVPRGFPKPDVPRFDIWQYIIIDAISIAVVAYAVTISMGQIFSKKHKYRVDSNQELLALGIANIAASFFSVFPTSASLSRTLVNEECGAKSQIASLISCFCIFIVITFIGPLLASLPSCVLATIVTVAVRSLLMNCRDLVKLWKFSKHDFYIWIFTAFVTLSADIAEGVAAGILFAIFTIAIQSQQPSIKHLGQVRPNDFRAMNHYGVAKDTSFRIIRFDAPLIFANVDKFLDNVRDAAADTKHRKGSNESDNDDWGAIILDCHTWIYTDSMGIDAVQEIDEDLKNMKILILFANLKSSLRRQYETAGLLNHISYLQFYPSIQDALESAHQLVATQKSFFDVEKV
ncbi:unnamed protein product [Caenorhabditis angaria]|uniref:STAS domain-containing protein n=1 Tax=Caenorhabditis angaria TaxID=860376 RepID=A0A9P1J2N8_9PELO|nr:unnamed protein product [Caenorhabditis angaria]